MAKFLVRACAFDRARTPRRLAALPAVFGVLCLSCSSTGNLNWPSVKGEIHDRFPQVNHVSTSQLAEWLGSPEKPPPLLIDVRAHEEYEVSHLKDAIPAGSDEEAEAIVRGLNKDHPIVAYCSVGYRSAEFVNRLQTRGFSNAYNLEGSIFQWANEGRPVYANGSRVNRVHPYNKRWGQLLKRKLWSTP